MSILYPFGAADSQTVTLKTSATSAQTFTIIDNLTVIDIASEGITGNSTSFITPDAEAKTGALVAVKYAAESTSTGLTLTMSGTNGSITSPLITGTTYQSLYIYNGTDFDQLGDEASW